MNPFNVQLTEEQQQDVVPGLDLVGDRMNQLVVDDIAFCLKTFERPRVAQRCVNSILKMWPGAKIYQADDSQHPVAAKGVHKFWPLPHDVGVSAGRNHLIRNTTEAFVVQIDDDYIFDAHTDIMRMKQLLEDHEELVLAGGKCRHVRPGKAGWTKYFADIYLEGSTLRAPKVTRWQEEPDGLKWSYADTISNFWIAKRRMFDCLLWDERFKIGGEHADFFQRLQAANGNVQMLGRIQARHKSVGPKHSPLLPVVNAGRMQVAFIPSLYVTHKKDRPMVYTKYRKRDKQYEKLYRSMWGITKVNRWRYGKA